MNCEYRKVTGKPECRSTATYLVWSNNAYFSCFNHLATIASYLLKNDFQVTINLTSKVDYSD